MDEFQIKRHLSDNSLIIRISYDGSVEAEWETEVSTGAGSITGYSRETLSKEEVKELIALLVKSL
jgi:hypothetical protein